MDILNDSTYYKRIWPSTSTANVQIFMENPYYVKMTQEEIMLDPLTLKPGDEIIYLGYLLRFDKIAIHEVISVTPQGILVKNAYKVTHLIEDTSEFSTLKYAKKRHGELFI